MQSITPLRPVKYAPGAEPLDPRFGYCQPARPDTDQRAIDQIDAAILQFPHDADAPAMQYLRSARGFLNATDLPREQQLNLALQVLVLAIAAADGARLSLIGARAEAALVAVQEARGVHVSPRFGV